MGRKKQKVVEFKPFCYYCDKEFDDVSNLQQHQKLRHFACPVCNKKFSSAFSMSTHALQVHKESITKVPNAKSGRDSLDVTIYGMVNVPPELIQEKYREKIAELKKRKVDPGYLPAMPPIPDRAIPLNVPTLPVPPPTVPIPAMLPPMIPGMPPSMPPATVPMTMPPPGAIPMFMPPMGPMTGAVPPPPPPPVQKENGVPSQEAPQKTENGSQPQGAPVPSANGVALIYTGPISIEEKLAEMDRYRYIPLKAAPPAR